MIIECEISDDLAERLKMANLSVEDLKKMLPKLLENAIEAFMLINSGAFSLQTVMQDVLEKGMEAGKDLKKGKQDETGKTI